MASNFCDFKIGRHRKKSLAPDFETPSANLAEKLSSDPYGGARSFYNVFNGLRALKHAKNAIFAPGLRPGPPDPRRPSPQHIYATHNLHTPIAKTIQTTTRNFNTTKRHQKKRYFSTIYSGGQVFHRRSAACIFVLPIGINFSTNCNKNVAQTSQKVQAIFSQFL